MAVFCRLQTRRDERKERERKNACEGECVNETRMIGKETGSECDRKIEHVSERAKKGDEGGGRLEMKSCTFKLRENCV